MKIDQFLQDSYAGYETRLSAHPDAELTQVGPGTPCGDYLRRFWHPVALSSQLHDLPLAIRVLGEDLVLFRDLGGRTGLLHKHCSHRRASLEYGIITERGIRCCYHGWLYDVDGRILETPGEPEQSNIKDHLRHGAYPTKEYKGLVFTYMGAPEKTPAFPIYDTFELPGDGGQAPYQRRWDGVLGELRRRFEEAGDAERESLRAFRSPRPCPDCAGSRLRAEARAVRVGGVSIDTIARLPVEDALRFFEALEFEQERRGNL